MKAQVERMVTITMTEEEARDLRVFLFNHMLTDDVAETLYEALMGI